MSTTPPTFSRRLRAMFPAGEVVRYILVGGVNTVFGYGTFAALLFLLNHVAPPQLFRVQLTQPKLAVIASAISTPLNITVSYLNYKFFVFRTKGNYLREWLKAFSVYGVSTLIGLAALSVMTRIVETLLHGRAPLGKGTAGYIAGALMTLATTIISYVGHKKVTFGTPTNTGT